MKLIDLKKIKAIATDAAQKTKENVADLKEQLSQSVDATKTKIQNIGSDERVVSVCKEVKAVYDNEKTQKIISVTTNAVSKTGQITVKGLKVISGVQAVQDRKKSIKNKEEADALKAEIEATSEAIRDDLNETLENFGKYRLEALHNTVGVFLNYLERMNQRSKAKEYDFLRAVDLKQEELLEMKEIDMKASQAAKTLAIGGGFAAVGLVGTPVVVTGVVTAFASASTGVAISGLSGAAASNAVLAWLGGGAIASGGGGMAAGATVLTAITATATVGLAVIAVGTLASAFYSKKNTESEQYLADIRQWAAETEQSWIALNAIKERILEMHNITKELEARAMQLLSKMDAIVDNFDFNDEIMLNIFQQTAITIKSMSELAQTPILDDEGNINTNAKIIIAKTEKIINKEL